VVLECLRPKQPKFHASVLKYLSYNSGVSIPDHTLSSFYFTICTKVIYNYSIYTTVLLTNTINYSVSVNNIRAVLSKDSYLPQDVVWLIAHAELFQETYIMAQENIKLHLCELSTLLIDLFTGRASDFCSGWFHQYKLLVIQLLYLLQGAVLHTLKPHHKWQSGAICRVFFQKKKSRSIDEGRKVLTTLCLFQKEGSTISFLFQVLAEYALLSKHKTMGTSASPTSGYKLRLLLRNQIPFLLRRHKGFDGGIFLPGYVTLTRISNSLVCCSHRADEVLLIVCQTRIRPAQHGGYYIWKLFVWFS
jgi:hypothetical protein